MRFAIVGAGSIGQRHLRNLRALGHDVLVFDADPRRAEEAAAASGADVLPASTRAARPSSTVSSSARRPSRTCRWRVSRCPGGRISSSRNRWRPTPLA